MNIIQKIPRLLAFIAGATLLMAASNVNAAMMTFTDKFDLNPGQLISFSNGQGGNNQSFSFTHSIIADQDPAGDWNYGFDPETDVIDSAFLVLRLKDEENDTASESAHFIFDDQLFGTQTITSGGAIYAALFSSNLNSLLIDGILNVTIQNAGTTSGPQSGRSDFYFLDSTLTVNVKKGAQPEQDKTVPEPETYLLISLGLIAFGYSRRKQN